MNDKKNSNDLSTIDLLVKMVDEADLKTVSEAKAYFIQIIREFGTSKK